MESGRGVVVNETDRRALGRRTFREVMQADPRESDVVDLAVEQAPDILGVQGTAVLVGEDQVVG